MAQADPLKLSYVMNTGGAVARALANNYNSDSSPRPPPPHPLDSINTLLYGISKASSVSFY